ncbi:hypothetical protein L1Z50_18430, partial [Acinetobacter baumannii]|nr:hypothetical protein [Acinetobacter baumannii]MCF4456835.1 hypothetical protein [Acinetobacter baumannii]
ISLPFFVFFRFGGMPRAKGLFRAKVSNNFLETAKHDFLSFLSENKSIEKSLTTSLICWASRYS